MSRPRPPRTLLAAAVVLGLTALSGAPRGQTAPEDLVARERLRAAVEEVMQEHLSPAPDGKTRIDRAIRGIDRLVEIGPAAVPHLINDLEQESPATFDFCAYALGMLATADAEKALREAIDRAEDQGGGEWARTRKAWSGWALGLMGRADALGALSAGKLGAATYSIHSNMSVTEAVALQTAPESRPLLLARLEELREGDGWQERQAVISALRRLDDPTVAPRIVPFLSHENPVTRREAANALGSVGSTRDLDALAAALADDEPIVRRSVAMAMELIGPPARREAILERLAVETDSHARATLYRMLAWESTDKTFEILEGFSGRPDPRDRRGLVQAVGMLRPPRLGFLEEALTDPETSVALEAAMILARHGGDAARNLMIRELRSAGWNVAQALTTQLQRIGGESAGQAIAARLLGHLDKTITENRAVFPLQTMARALVALRHVEPLDDLKRGAANQTEHRLVQTLTETIDQLQLLKKRGRNVQRWIKGLDDPVDLHRHLTYSRLGELGGEKAARALVEAFDAAPDDDAVEILRAAGNLDTPATTRLLTRVLLDPEFDPVAKLPQREMAAWGARRLGGQAMFDLLRRAADRRHGRDAKILVYATLVNPEAGSELIRAHRRERMRYIGWYMGQELMKLDWITRRLATGLPIERYDLAPNLLSLR